MAATLRHVIFDLDGTLADTWPVIFPAYRAAFAPYIDREWSDGDITALFGPNEEGIIRGVVPGNAEEAIDLYIDHYCQNHHKASLFGGVETLLERLQKASFKMALVTGKGPRSAYFSLEQFGIAHYFEAVKTGSEKGTTKRDAIGEVTELWGVLPQDVAYVGDTPGDVIESKAAGAKALAAVWSDTCDHVAIEAQRPDGLFESPDALTALLLEPLSMTEPK